MSNQEPLRHVPVRPNLRQLKQQAKDLLHALRSGDQAAIEEFNQSHPSTSTIPPDQIKLSRRSTCIGAELWSLELAAHRPGLRTDRCDLARRYRRGPRSCNEVPGIASRECARDKEMQLGTTDELCG